MCTLLIKTPQISLAAARVNGRFNQTEFAELLGVNQTTIVKWESGKSQPNMSQLRMISQLSNIPMDFIYLTEKSEKNEL